MSVVSLKNKRMVLFIDCKNKRIDLRNNCEYLNANI